MATGGAALGPSQIDKKGRSVAVASYDKVELMLLFFARHVSKFKKTKKKDLKRLSFVFLCDLEAVDSRFFYEFSGKALIAKISFLLAAASR